jgi:hypothetical protein
MTCAISGFERVLEIYQDIHQALEVSQVQYKFNFEELGNVVNKIAKLTEILVCFQA